MTEEQNKKLQEILDTANEAYHIGELRLNEDLPLGERGDTLADFIAFEIREVTEGDTPDRMTSTVIHAMESAKQQIMEVLESLYDLDKS